MDNVYIPREIEPLFSWPVRIETDHRRISVPLDRLLIETDSPDVPPSGCIPPNEPANLVFTFRAVAELRGIAEADLADALRETGNKILGIRTVKR